MSQNLFNKPFTTGYEIELDPSGFPATLQTAYKYPGKNFWQVESQLGPGMLVLSSPNACVAWTVDVNVKSTSGLYASTHDSRGDLPAQVCDRRVYMTGPSSCQYIPLFGDGAQIRYQHWYSIASGASIDQVYGIEYSTPAGTRDRRAKAIFYPGMMEEPITAFAVGLSDNGFPAVMGSWTAGATVYRFYPVANHRFCTLTSTASSLVYGTRYPGNATAIGAVSGVYRPTLFVPPEMLVEAHIKTGPEEGAVCWAVRNSSYPGN